MKRYIPLLTAILLIQIVIAVSANIYTRKAPGKMTELLSIKGEAVDKITITDSDKHKVVLVEKGDSWTVNNHYSSPADTQKITSNLKNIGSVKIHWPVATSDSAPDRFHVGRETFKKKIILQQGKKILATIYLGDATGAHGSYMRLNDQNEIYQSTLTLFDYATDPDQWIDQHQLKISPEDIHSIKFNDVQLTRENKKFIPAGIDVEKVDKAKIQKLVAIITDPTLTGVLGDKEKPGYNMEKAALTLEIKGNDHKKVTYILGKPEKESYFVLKTSTNPLYFKIGAWQINSLVQTKKDSLLKVDKAENKTEEK